MNHRIKVRPITFRDACLFIAGHHRHHRPPQGHRFSLAAWTDKVIGVVVVGRPVARNLDDGLTAEVTRLCTDGTANCCSFLYGAARRVAKEMGYHRILTYILGSERGDSLRASGWSKEMDTTGGSWSCKSRVREDKHPTEPKQRWGCRLQEEP